MAAIMQIFLFGLFTSVLAIPLQSRSTFSYFNDNTIFQSPPSYTSPGTLYARTIQLPDTSLLATWENYSPEPPNVYFPIYKSTDLGLTWTEFSRVQDTQYNFGLRYQPFLYYLNTTWSTFSAGTIFLAGSAIPTNLSSTHIELYASTDSGLTWAFVSHIASGGEAVPDNGLTPVWEPFLMLYNDMLVCYYSDQRDPAHGQKLVHQTTTDGVTWGEVVDDVAYANYTSRPGMTTVAQMEDGRYVMTYENGGGAVDGVLPVTYTFPVYYKISEDPLGFDAVEGMPIVTNDTERVVPVSSPYIIEWNGELIVSCGTLSQVFVNKVSGDVDGWEQMETGETVSYTRSLRILEDGTGGEALLLAGGGALPPATGNATNRVTVGVVQI